jgi:hypothetical protein
VSSNILDIGLGFQATVNPLGNAIPSPAFGGGARDLGIGDDPAMKLLVQTVGTVAGGTSIQINIEGAPDDGTGNPGAFDIYALGPVIPLARLAQIGSRLFDIDMPRVPWEDPLPRYLQLSYEAVGTFTSGSVVGFLVLDRFDQIISVAGFTSGYIPGVVVDN